VHDKDAFLQAAQLSADTYAEQSINPQVAYLMNSALKDVIAHGTGRGVQAVGLKRNDLAGKTGTTNDQKDAWFAGFNSDLVTVVWVGYDQPRSLYEYAANAALPSWAEFMKLILTKKPEHHMPQPPGIVSARINPDTGNLTTHWDKQSIFEYFIDSTVPAFSNQPQHSIGSSNRQPGTTPQLPTNDEKTILSSDERLF